MREKGEAAELESEESVQAASVGAEKYPLSEGMDLSVSRQRYFVSQYALLQKNNKKRTHAHKHIHTRERTHTHTHS